MSEAIRILADLRGLRSAPALSADQRELLRTELTQVMAPCTWFTIGVMAPSAAQALSALRRWEAAFGWPPLVDADPSPLPLQGPVFLKGHQRNGSFRLRQESGLGEGVLLSGQEPDQPERADTWGPLPLDLV